MKQGMLWYDNLNGRKLNERIEAAVNYFTQKYGKKPEQCFVHPGMIVGESASRLPIKVIADNKILEHHIWIEFPQLESQSDKTNHRAG
jgi:hypothetical protein